MKLLVLGPSAISVLCLYLGIYHFWLYRRIPALKAHLYFVLSAMAVGAYGFFCALLYQGQEPALAPLCNRAQISAAILFCPAFVYFTSIFLGLKVTRFHRLYLLTAFAGIFITLFTGLVFTDRVHWTYVPFPESRFPEADIGPGAYVFALYVLGGLAIGVYLITGGLKRGMYWVKPIMVSSSSTRPP